MRVASRLIDVQAVATGVVLGAVFGAATYLALGLRGDARYAPLLATVPGLAFALYELVRGLIGRPAPDAGDPPAPGAAPASTEVTRVPLSLADRVRSSGELWLLLLLGLFLVFGTVTGLLLFVVLYMRLRSRAPWLGVLANLAIVYLSLQVLFFRILNLPTYGGFLRGML